MKQSLTGTRLHLLGHVLADVDMFLSITGVPFYDR